VRCGVRRFNRFTGQKAQRQRLAPAVKPAPTDANITRSPSLQSAAAIASRVPSGDGCRSGIPYRLRLNHDLLPAESRRSAAARGCAGLPDAESRDPGQPDGSRCGPKFRGQVRECLDARA